MGLGLKRFWAFWLSLGTPVPAIRLSPGNLPEDDKPREPRCPSLQDLSLRSISDTHDLSGFVMQSIRPNWCNRFYGGLWTLWKFCVKFGVYVCFVGEELLAFSYAHTVVVQKSCTDQCLIDVVIGLITCQMSDLSISWIKLLRFWWRWLFVKSESKQTHTQAPRNTSCVYVYVPVHTFVNWTGNLQIAFVGSMC